MRILFLGDVVGRAGREAVERHLPDLRARLSVDLAVVNGENASHGFGLAPAMADGLFAAGADVITLGNHAFDRKELIGHIERTPRIIRPLNYAPGTPGVGFVLVDLPAGRRALVVNVMCRLFMELLDDPFRATQELLARHRLGGALAGGTVHAILVDLHGEATSEKAAFGHSFDGRVSVVVGTHTHVPTADHQVLPGGTAYQTDAGMCGDYDSVIGMNKDVASSRFWRKLNGERLSPAEGEATICGLFVETDDGTGLAIRAEPVRVGGRLHGSVPALSTTPDIVALSSRGAT